MDWSPDQLNQLPNRGGFRLRGESMTRLEVFSDAAFAFAMTMLVVSVGEIPKSLDELLLALKSVPAFALSFIQIAAFWAAHRAWSRRYGLEDHGATILTLAMIFIILVYVYPLRLIFSSFFEFFSRGWLPGEFEVTGPGSVASLFMIYGIGFAALTGVLGLMHVHAYRHRDNLHLNSIERIRTREGICVWGVQSCVGIISSTWAALTPDWLGAYAGFAYFILAPAVPLVATWHARQIKQTSDPVSESSTSAENA